MNPELAGNETQLVGVRAVSIYIYFLLAMASSEHPVISPSLLANIDTPKWVDPDLFDLGSPFNEFMLNIEDEIALVEAVVDYETLERAVVS